MPSYLYGHKLVTINTDLVAIGGSGYHGYFQEIYMQSSMHRLTCQNQECWWQTLSTQLTIGRMQFVTILIPDDTVDCDGK